MKKQVWDWIGATPDCPCLTCLISQTLKNSDTSLSPVEDPTDGWAGLGQKLLGAQKHSVLGSKRHACSAAKHLSLRLLL